MAPHDVASIICPALGRGVTRSKRRAMQWLRRAAELGHAMAYLKLAAVMYADWPYAREVGHVDVGEATGAATPAGVMEGHDVPPDVLTSVVYWMRKFCVTGQRTLSEELDGCRMWALLGDKYCVNEGCEVNGHLKDFKVCRSARPPGTAATRVRNRTGLRVGTGKRVARDMLTRPNNNSSYVYLDTALNPVSA